MPQSGSDLIAIGRILKPVGLKGEVIVASFGQTLGTLRVPCDVVLTSENAVPVKTALATLRPHGNGWVCRFSAYESREEAETLRNRMVAVSQSDLPGLEEGKYYHFELVGMEVVGMPEGKVLGIVAEVHDYPTIDALEVRREGYPPVVIPMSQEAIERVDTQERKIFVRSEIIDELL